MTTPSSFSWGNLSAADKFDLGVAIASCWEVIALSIDPSGTRARDVRNSLPPGSTPRAMSALFIERLSNEEYPFESFAERARAICPSLASNLRINCDNLTNQRLIAALAGPANAGAPGSERDAHAFSWGDLSKSMRDDMALVIGSQWNKICATIGHRRVEPSHVESSLPAVSCARDKALKFMEMLEQNDYPFRDFAMHARRVFPAFPSMLQRYIRRPIDPALMAVLEG